MATERHTRAAWNQLLFWSLNGRISSGDAAVSATSSVDFYCECDDQACAGKIGMTIKEFRLLETTPDGFIVLAGHDRPDAEHVVDERNGYVIVQEHEPVRDQSTAFRSGRSFPAATKPSGV